jgi:hypothetical protein
MHNHLKIGSAILSPDYFWMTECGKCDSQPEVHHQADGSASERKIEPSAPPSGQRSFRFELKAPGLYRLLNFCGGGFRFDAQVRIDGDSVAILHLQGNGKC